MKNVLVCLLAMVLIASSPVSMLAGKEGYGVTYDGGSISNIKVGEGVRLLIDGDKIRILKGNSEVANIPSSAVTDISYGQDVHRRVWAAIGLAMISFGVGAFMLLVKSKKHFVGLTWANGEVKGGFAIQCDKNEYRGILAGLEGVRGKKAVDSDAMTVKN